MEVDLNRKLEHPLNSDLIEKNHIKNSRLVAKEVFTTHLSHQVKYLQKL